MQLSQFVEALKSLEGLDPAHLPRSVAQLKSALDSFGKDYSKLGHSLYQLCEHIMKVKGLKSEQVEHFEDLINEAIVISIRNDFRVGYDALRFVFNMHAEFYKTNNLDTSLAYPLGKERPLEQYNPEVGEDCDTVRPYITSTSFCGWTRCTVLEIENNRYTIKYANSDSPNTTREKPWFAPLGSRMKDYEWRMGLDIGMPVDAYLNRVWYKATIAEVGKENECKKVRVTYRRFAEDGDQQDSFGNKFFGLPGSEDEWLDVLSPRIQASDKMSDVKLCYYTAKSEQILHDDFYDALFQQQYKQMPFYAIPRLVNNKSLSLMNFINTFIRNNGLEKLLEIMQNPDIADEIVFSVMTQIAVMVPFFPRMYVKESRLLQLYERTIGYFRRSIKTLNAFKLDAGYFCYDMIGRRMLSLTEVYKDENNLRKLLIKQFLKMNMQKQMLALRYLNDLIYPKKPFSQEERDDFHSFLKNQEIFAQIFNASTHEQIISRTSSLLQYLIENNIISIKQFQVLWHIVPASDARGRAVIERLLSDNTKKLPISYVELLISKILSLKETELTLENLNLLKELKNREISNQYQMKILGFLWDVLTFKSANIKTNIEEEVEKVFKAFVSTLVDLNIRMKVMESMNQKLQDCKKLKNQIQLLKDFIKSYPDKVEKEKMQDENQKPENVPETTYEAVRFLKQKNIYSGLLALLFKSKEENIKKDILEFFSFLFSYDEQNITPIITQIYLNLGPSVNFLEWVNKLSSRALEFAVQLLQKTTQFGAYQNLATSGFQALQKIIVDVNAALKNIKVVTTYEYSNSQDSKAASQSTGTQATETFPGPIQGPAQQKDGKLIGPTPPESKKHIFVLVSPFKLVGMKFLQHLLHVVKQNVVYNDIIKLIVQFISRLDTSIQDKSEKFRREFLDDIIHEIKQIVQENAYNEQIKLKLQVYINLFTEIFAETEKNGLSDLQPHFQKVEGEKITLTFDNPFAKDNKELSKITISCNENITFWRLKKLLAERCGVSAHSIDIIKYVDPISDNNHGKSLNELLFYDKQNCKLCKKKTEVIPRASLINEQKTHLTQKFEKIVYGWFEAYKDAESGHFGTEQFQRLNKEKWKGSLFKKQYTPKVIIDDYDMGQKGYLTYPEFRQVFLEKSIKNDVAVWRLLALARFRNDLRSTEENIEVEEQRVEALPRKILSCPEVYHLIFTILANQNFKEIHLNFYRLLSLLEADQSITSEIEDKIYQTISTEKSIYNLCYVLELANSELAKKQQFYFEFWDKGGVGSALARVQEVLDEGKPIYELDPLMRNAVLPGLIKILNIYASELLGSDSLVRFINSNKVNYLEVNQFVKKVKQNAEEIPPTLSQGTQKLLSYPSTQDLLKKIALLSERVFWSLVSKYENEKTEYLPKMTTQTVRLVCSLSCRPDLSTLKPEQLLPGIRNCSLNLRRSVIILMYIKLFHTQQPQRQSIEDFLRHLLADMPLENKMENHNYFILLKQMLTNYMELTSSDSGKDGFFAQLCNSLLDKLFSLTEGEPRSSYLPNKIIQGILENVEELIKRDPVGRMIASRRNEITEKCLFAYQVEDRIKAIEIIQQLLQNPRQAQHLPNYVICKTEETRNIAYNIVARLHEVSDDREACFITDYILPIVRAISLDVRITSSRTLDVGLKNFGSTCYMNSMLQVLNSVAPFRNSIMKVESQAPIIKELKKLFASLYFSERVDYAPGSLLTAFVPPINPGIQQDTTEFLNFLFDQVESGLAPTDYRRLLDEIFKGANTVQMICHSCGYKKQNREEFFSYGVEIENKFDLLTALEGTYQGEVISDYYCDNCHNRGETTKRNVLSEVPNVMFVHLRRIVFNYDMFVNMKIHTRLQFPNELNIEPYTKEGVELREQLGLEYIKNLAHNEEEAKKFEQMVEHGKQKDFYKLKLKGIIVHSGSADVGHYYSILPSEKIWRKYDDSRVGIFTMSDFENECYGGSFTAEEWGSGSSVNAYVLVYEKVVKDPIRLTLKREGLEEEVSIPYDDIKVHNSKEDYIQLWLDNHNFMVESHLLDSKLGKGFISFVTRLIKSSSISVRNLELISEIVYKISFHSGIIGDLDQLLFANAPELNPDIFYSFVVADKGKTFKLLFSHEKKVREFMSSYLHIVLIQSYKKGDAKVKLDVVAYIMELLNALTAEAAKNWLRIDGYLRLFYLLVCSSLEEPDLYQMFRDRNLISTLIDYVMEKQSPVRINPKNYSLGTKSTPMDFSSGVSLLSLLVRHSYGFTGNNYEVPAIPEARLFHLNDNDVICLSHMQFYRKMFQERQNVFEMATLVQRLCIRNLEFSRAIIEVVLTTIGAITDAKDEMTDLAYVCLQILKIRDDFWAERAEMLLGVSNPYVSGNNLMTTLDEQRYVFTSTIYEIFPVECLFAYVYLYRLKNILACFYLMRAIIEGCSVSDLAMHYLAKQPAPSYLHASYVDFLEDYLHKFVSFLSLEPKKREKIELEVANLMKYVHDLKEYRKQHEDSNCYKSVITGEVASTSVLETFEKNGIQVKVISYDVYCLPSRPTLVGNLSLDPYIDGFKPRNAVAESSNLLKFFRKPTKAIALKLQPVEEDEDKELVSLFDTQGPSNVQPVILIQPKPEEAKVDEDKKKPQPQAPVLPAEPMQEEQIHLEEAYIIDYFRQIEVQNTGRDKKIVQLNFKTEQLPNFVIPSSFTWKVFHKSSESLWIAKQDPNKPWGDLNMTSNIEQFDKDKHQKKNVTKWWFKTYGEPDSVSAQPPIPEEPQPAKPEAAFQEEALEADVMQCPQCTVFNPLTNKNCEVCDFALH